MIANCTNNATSPIPHGNPITSVGGMHDER
jgi:hypothetical protein